MYSEMTIGKRISNLIVTAIFVFVIIIIFLIIFFKVTTYHIVGHSMNPTLTEGELVLAIPQKTYKRGDVIAFDLDDNNTIKRIIGIPGDKVFIDNDGTVYVNDKELNEKYIKSKVRGDIEVVNPYQVIEGEYFVLGDNRGDSKDSRLLKVGAIKEGQIKAKIVASISKFKIIK